ncbi:sterol desaturase family protein [Porticoccaceae bacterium]|nr:sterol desaturase family protein [Porticoccaceae bacterium]
MNFVPYAIPVFLLMIVLELGYGLLKGNNTYRVNDSINSLSMGLLSTVTKFVFLNIGALVFAQISREYAIWSFDINSLGHWLLAILLYDFLYYWFHRISHERQFFWGSHVVHHQSEDYNLSTALRQTSTSFATTWVFYIPCFFLGMPISMFVSIASAHLIYQFWVHTQHIPKLGIFEWFMVSPSNHRVHHAQNADYIDKNYGGLLIIWDRLFGTFKAEEEKQQAIYGIRVPLRSWNPIWANLHIFAAMLRDIWHTQRWSDKFRVLWSKTGWHPEDMVVRFPEKKSDLQQFEKYNPQHSSWVNGAIILQYLLLAALHFWSAGQSTLLSSALMWAVVLAQVAILLVIGALLDGKAYAGSLEYARLLALSAMLWISYSAELISSDWLGWGAGYLITSGVLMGVCVTSDRKSSSSSTQVVAK